ncbi:MAG: 1-acyl-sn-glycerol-3-phosphate acyltransferase [Saprospiraceae bacterium]|nr:1-acyl-sn-glycerol-3-phosphate acyltransferase [Saprospiraceae bacterium]
MNFEDIRPYRNHEIKKVLEVLLSDKRFDKGLHDLLKQEKSVQWIRSTLAKISTIEEIQSQIMIPLLNILIKKNTNGISTSGVEKLDPNTAYVFVSNHRDIVTDAAFLNLLMSDNGLNTTEIAIGSNLLIFPWIRHVVKANRAFIVKRNLPIKQLLLASQQLSHYIRHTVTEQNTSIWIAQREGRTKDGCDQTQAPVLKMLNMSNPSKDLIKGFNTLKIVPLSISYEIEPCGASKVKELMLKKGAKGYKKSLEDDLFAMNSSLEDPVGSIHFGFGDVIDIAQVLEGSTELKPKQVFDQLARYIDQQIYKNYRLSKNNYIAHDLLYKEHKYKAHYTLADKEAFQALSQERLEKEDVFNEEAMQYWLQMYANPVKNCVPAQSLMKSQVD